VKKKDSELDGSTPCPLNFFMSTICIDIGVQKHLNVAIFPKDLSVIAVSKLIQLTFDLTAFITICETTILSTM
jgi:hypothetical protein